MLQFKSMGTSQEAEKASNFEQFWPSYVRLHSHPVNRQFHAAGTLLAFICLAIAAVTEKPVFIFVALGLGYGLAWLGHFFIEKNRPATFSQPVFSLIADFRMLYLVLNGKMQAEVDRIVGAHTKGSKS